MPKENVYGDYQKQSVEVTWGRDQDYVQVGARFKGQPFQFEKETTEDLGRFESLHVTLTSRGAINDLIRTLRKARDQAFGADA